MAKQDKGPSDAVRFPASITVADRARLRIVAAHLGRSMEDLAGEWLVDRLGSEEAKLGLPRQAKAPKGK